MWRAGLGAGLGGSRGLFWGLWGPLGGGVWEFLGSLGASGGLWVARRVPQARPQKGGSGGFPGAFGGLWGLLGAAGGLRGPLGAVGGHDRYPRAPRGTTKTNKQTNNKQRDLQTNKQQTKGPTKKRANKQTNEQTNKQTNKQASKFTKSGGIFEGFRKPYQQVVNIRMSPLAHCKTVVNIRRFCLFVCVCLSVCLLVGAFVRFTKKW